MLVLTRRSNQSIVIGTDVTITVLEIHGDSVRIGVDAPRSVQVHRSEVFEAVQEANRAAATQGKPPLESLGGSAAELRNRQNVDREQGNASS
ncbi:MAG: carbon storage regulator [Frankiales bacterium]|nr:carbon storage regulator [Frankiales bacterium]